ncbi:MAG TPA: DevR family CRISPR-associated autoregulator [Dehalococcoidia bacterium]|nr:DevR family CRISPR-associated autoregulator [Dehalococcoidia bacterium]
MTTNDAVFEIGLMMRATWDLHSLNNEGTVGNVSEPRTVVLADGTKTDGVSGEMLKHLHTFNVWLAERQKDRFCPACQRLQPQKADLPEYRRTFSGTDNVTAMARAISNCILCDLHGFLLQAPAISRRSTVEFGWAVGLPEVYRDIHVHARHAVAERMQREEREEARREREERRRRGEEVEPEEVAAQMVYHRPTRSGVYAVVSLFQPWRIGLNEITYEYAIDDASRLARYRLGLEGYRNLLQRGDGAMTSTRLPHIEGVEGIIAVSRQNAPAPVISPLREDYSQQLEALAAANGRVTLYRFNTVAEACGVLDKLAEMTLYPFRS